MTISFCIFGKAVVLLQPWILTGNLSLILTLHLFYNIIANYGFCFLCSKLNERKQKYYSKQPFYVE